MLSYTPQFKHEITKKLHLTCSKVLGAVCTHLASSAASRDSAVKLTTDSYQFWVAHLNLRVTFQLHITATIFFATPEFGKITSSFEWFEKLKTSQMLKYI